MTEPVRELAPRLPSTLAVRRRGAGAVMMTGGSPGALVLEGLTETETTAVVGLTAALRAPGVVRHRCAPSARWSQVLGAVHRAAARLTAGQTVAGQALVLGAGPLPEEICRALQPVVGRVVNEPEALLAPESDPAGPPADLVVLPAVDALAPLAGQPWQRRGIPQLPVVVSGGRLSVGPLVRPGSGPCLSCLDLHRGARDPGWASWLASRAVHTDVDREMDTVPELRSAAAALTALIARGLLEHEPLPAGVSLSLERPQPRVRHHLWTCHPSCCGAAEARVTMRA
ncbi:hypothetical protein [Flexivirga lutea]